MTAITEATMRRFWAKVAIDPAGHLLWTANKSRGGYGLFRAGDSTVIAHRFAYEALVGAIPEGMQLDHLCRIRHCVAPNCLEPVTPRENTLRSEGLAALNAVKTHCLNGHPFDENNTYINCHGNRQCRECQRVYDRAYQAQRRLTHKDVINAQSRARYATRDDAWKDATNAAVRARRAARNAAAPPDPLVVGILALFKANGTEGLTAPQVARAVFEAESVSRAQLEKVRSRLDKLAGDDRLIRHDGLGKTSPATYYPGATVRGEAS
ncbi:HNH endonuclease signature motif containing protein [Streptomyces sp. RPT161]|uniref:HNH endonuclease signature motif containing protein n=1 Tax=Streptomyces sp. RPT161 TaxID=3015993 RepID=UPI0022B8B4E7|nr:HNH endonuclease signature motif containing protein [Streptomyces sp. RPT161]